MRLILSFSARAVERTTQLVEAPGRRFLALQSGSQSVDIARLTRLYHSDSETKRMIRPTGWIVQIALSILSCSHSVHPQQSNSLPNWYLFLGAN